MFYDKVSLTVKFLSLRTCGPTDLPAGSISYKSAGSYGHQFSLEGSCSSFLRCSEVSPQLIIVTVRCDQAMTVIDRSSDNIATPLNGQQQGRDQND